jgi:hypothetical protein
MPQCRPVVLAALVFALAACRNDGLIPVTAIHPVVVTASSDQVEVEQGGVQLIAVNVVRPTGYVGTLVVVADSLPAGVLVQTSADQTADGITSLLLAVQADRGTAIGTYPIRIRAREASGADPDGVTTLAVLVAPPGSGEYTLQVRPVSLTPGTSGSATVGLTRVLSAFDVPVTLSADSLPSGITVRFSPTIATKAIAGMTVVAAASVVPGLYTIRIRGQVSGSPVADRLASVPVVVRTPH